VLFSGSEEHLLTFARKAGQAIRIGDSIKITVKELRGRQVRLMIEAPLEIPVFREEIYEQIVEANKQAARVPSPDLLKGLE
jgi:carbon storage regulator